MDRKKSLLFSGLVSALSANMALSLKETLLKEARSAGTPKSKFCNKLNGKDLSGMPRRRKKGSKH